MKRGDLGVRHAMVGVNGLRMHYVAMGDGPLVLLLHGFPEMWWSWRYQIPALANAGFRVVAPDLRGYNETDAKGPFDIDTLRDDVVGLLDALGARDAIVVGHDWGGAIAWHLASTRPELCAKLVVMNCPHPVPFLRAIRGNFRQIRRSWYIFFFQLPVLPERMLTQREGRGAAAMLRSMAIDKTHFGAAELEPFAKAVCMPGRASAMIGWYRAMFRRGIRMGSKELSVYGTIRNPTLLLWAMEDRAFSYRDVVVGMERFVPGIEIQKIEGCGHFLQQEQPEEVNRRLIGWLKG
jgi:epoxide hydrolase 4